MEIQISAPCKDLNTMSHIRAVFLSDAEMNRNGVGTYYRDLVDYLANHIECAELICPQSTSRLSRYFALPMPGDPTQKIFIPNVYTIWKRIREIRPHIVVAATPGPFGLAGLLLGKWTKSSMCAGYHTQFEDLVGLYWNRAAANLSRKILVGTNKLFFLNCSVVAVTNAGMIETAHNTGAKVVKLVGTPIPYSFLSRPLIPASDQVKNILYAGRLAPEKNISTILSAAKSLPNIQFTIAGDGPLRKDVKKEANRLTNIDYLGWVDREDFVSVLDNCDLLLLPSEKETFGTVALEAIARKRPVLVSRNCGILKWNSLAEGIYQIKNGETLANAIQRIQNISQARRKATAEMAYRSAQNLNSETVNQWIDIFVNLLNFSK